MRKKLRKKVFEKKKEIVKNKKTEFEEKNTEIIEKEEKNINVEKYEENFVYSPDLTIDIPENIYTVKIFEKNLCCLVNWKIRPNGIIPEQSYVLSNYLKEKHPLVLIEFYESKISRKKNKIK